MKILAIIPARSGSKGLKNKNILKLNEKPLINYTIEAALKSNIFDEVFVSTDSEEYAQIAEACGAVAHPLRSEELSTDTSPSSAFLIDILQKKSEYDTFVLLQPTSPFRNEYHIKDAIELFNQKAANAVVSMVKSDKSPNIINTFGDDLCIDGFLKVDSKNYARQNEVNYIPNGAIFICRSEYYLKHIDFYNSKSFAYVMDKISSVDIDDELDFKFCELLLKEGRVKWKS